MSEPKIVWGPGTPWATKSAFYVYLRGCLRKAWNRHPNKLNKIKSVRVKIDKPMKNGKVKQVWGCQCEICKKIGPMADFQVDHIVEAGTLTCFEDIPGFVERLLFVNEEDLRLLCKQCNAILNHACRRGITYEEAKAEKEAISLVSSNKDKEWLMERNIIPESSKPKRRKQIIDAMKALL